MQNVHDALGTIINLKSQLFVITAQTFICNCSARNLFSKGGTKTAIGRFSIFLQNITV